MSLQIWKLLLLGPFPKKSQTGKKLFRKPTSFAVHWSDPKDNKLFSTLLGQKSYKMHKTQQCCRKAKLQLFCAWPNFWIQIPRLSTSITAQPYSWIHHNFLNWNLFIKKWNELFWKYSAFSQKKMLMAMGMVLRLWMFQIAKPKQLICPLNYFKFCPFIFTPPPAHSYWPLWVFHQRWVCTKTLAHVYAMCVLLCSVSFVPLCGIAVGCFCFSIWIGSMTTSPHQTTNTTQHNTHSATQRDTTRQSTMQRNATQHSRA